MRIRLTCFHCLDGSESWPVQNAMADLDETGVYYLTCQQGHQLAFCLQNFKFELLFNLALQAIHDGYYREAVSSFASALERFQEFYVEVLFDAAAIPRSAYDAAWKKVANTSERQMGAFLFMFASQEKTSPPGLTDEDAKFRNGVVHKGKFPTRDETIGFGQKVADIIGPTLDRLRQVHDTVIQDMRKRLLASIQAKVVAPFEIFNLYQMTYISASSDANQQRQPVRSQIEAIEKARFRCPTSR